MKMITQGFQLAAIIIVFQGSAMASEWASRLVADVKDVRATDNSARVDVSAIVKQHIPAGSSWYTVSGDLIAEGFQCYARAPSGGGSDSRDYHCLLDLRHWYDFGFGDRLKLFIEVRNDEVVEVGGTLDYLAL